MINKKIFKAYDIRGIYPNDLNGQVAENIGQAIVKILKPKKVVLGMDNRIHSNEIKSGLIDGLRKGGVDVVDAGLTSTPMLNFIVMGSGENFDLGLQITASHNPAEWNGIKMVTKEGQPIGFDSGLQEIYELIEKTDHLILDTPTTGGWQKQDYTEKYLAKICNLVNLDKIKPFKIVVDTGNAIVGHYIEKFFAKLPNLEVTYLYKELDGTFPNHEANPLKFETLEVLQKTVLEQRADLGVAFDGDGDRIGLIDNLGNVVTGDLITAFLAPLILKKYSQGKVLFDLRSSLVVKDKIKQAGGQPVMCRVGRTFIIEQMKATDAVFGGELSNHFYYKDFYYMESGCLTLLLILRLMSEEDRPLSELFKELKVYHHSGEINFRVEDKDSVFEKLEAKYSEQSKSFSKMDGLRFEFNDSANPDSFSWWFNVRASNTEPVLRLNLEAKSEELMKQKLEEVKAIIMEVENYGKY